LAYLLCGLRGSESNSSSNKQNVQRQNMQLQQDLKLAMLQQHRRHPV